MTTQPMTIECPKCGNRTSMLGDFCEHCGCYIKKAERKKPIHKKWWFWVIIVIVAFWILPFGESDDNDTKTDDKATNISESTNQINNSTASENTNTNTDTDNKKDSKPSEVESVKDGTYKEGTYKVGVDIEPGEYVLFATGSVAAYFEITSNSKGDLDSITSNENFNYNVIVTVHEGEYIQIKRAYAVPIEDAEIDTSGEGQFKVGLHIEAGEYRVILDGDNGYVEVTEDSRHTLDSIKANDNLSGDSYITVDDGDYLYVKRCHIIKV